MRTRQDVSSYLYTYFGDLSHTGTPGGRWDLGVSRVQYHMLGHFGQWAVAITLQLGGPVGCGDHLPSSRNIVQAL